MYQNLQFKICIVFKYKFLMSYLKRNGMKNNSRKKQENNVGITIQWSFISQEHLTQ